MSHLNQLPEESSPAPCAEVLREELERLQNSVHQLERSNKELEEEMKLHGRDRDYSEAVGENIVLLAKQKARIASLLEEISKAEGGSGVWL